MQQSVFLRRKEELFFKGAAEIAGIFKTAGVGNLIDGIIGMQKHGLSDLQTVLGQKQKGGDLCNELKDPTEVEFAYIAKRSQKLYGDVAAVFRANFFQCRLNGLAVLQNLFSGEIFRNAETVMQKQGKEPVKDRIGGDGIAKPLPLCF